MYTRSYAVKVDFELIYSPVGQIVQTVAPVKEQSTPLVHGKQDVDSVVLENVPGTHGVLTPLVQKLPLKQYY